MAKAKRKDGLAVNPDLPDALAEAVRRAEGGLLPTATPTDEKDCPNLLAMLLPRSVRDPRHRGSGEPPPVLMEPLLMISWDRLNGRFKWVITNRILNTTGGMGLTQLSGLAEEIERQLGSGEVPWKAIKAT